MATMGPKRPHNPRYSGPSMIRRPEINPQLAAALIAWLGDFDDGWGDRGESREAENGGYAQKSHGDEHLDKVFDLIRIARRTFRHDPDGSRDGEPWPPAEMEHYKAIDDPIMMMVSGDVDLDDPEIAEAMEDIRQAGVKSLERTFTKGDRVEVLDEGLKALRDVMARQGRQVESNHHGFVDEVLEDGDLLILFDDGQAAPYPATEVRHLADADLDGRRQPPDNPMGPFDV